MAGKKVGGLLLLIIALSVLLIAAPALAMGLGVSPEKLDIEVSRGGSASAMLGITNTGNEESTYRVYVEEEKYKGWFTIEPEEFTLPAQGKESVEVSISPPVNASGEHEVRICIVSLPPEGGLAVGTGIKVPTYIHISAMLSSLWIIGISIAVILAVALVIVLWRRRARY